ncbi:hypothetical protein C8A00DRAFT_15298 [Chaetomidium leptoderma]|uniref:Transmembrane protein n=1 Tax=Chaetomidium leptoderma TaxID=669021 RepID=A0AAN6VLG8_9PEZI|nr:hypothetical protein C8A00DRAFT_15298 [Chaetomidium leptoderma]
MDEPPSKNIGPSPIPPPTPSSPYTAGFLTPAGTRPRLGPRRQSRFTEDMSERTPAASVSERSMDYSWYGPSAEDVNTNINNTSNLPVPNPGPCQAELITSGRQNRRIRWLRLVNGALHAIPCLVLLGIVGYAMRVLREDMRSYRSIQAVVLICVLFADIILDVITLFRAHAPWPTWGLVLRFVCGLAYIALFLVYVGLGGPFPKGYTYWGLSVDLAAPVVYTLLCVEGLWNLLHIPVCRYQLLGNSRLLGRAVPNPRPASTLLDNRTSFNQRFSVAGTEHSSISLTWRRWVRTQSTHISRDDLENSSGGGGVFHRTITREPSADFTLREQPGEEDEGEAGSSRVTSSHEGKGGGSEKWREGKSEDTVRPARTTADVGQ